MPAHLRANNHYQYGGDSKTMAQGTFVTTLGAVFTIPLLAVLFMA